MTTEERGVAQWTVVIRRWRERGVATRTVTMTEQRGHLWRGGRGSCCRVNYMILVELMISSHGGGGGGGG